MTNRKQKLTIYCIFMMTEDREGEGTSEKKHEYDLFLKKKFGKRTAWCCMEVAFVCITLEESNRHPPKEVSLTSHCNILLLVIRNKFH